MSNSECDECGKTEGKLRLCTRCRQVRYCSTDCQRKAWVGGHKDKCGSSAADKPPQQQQQISDETRRSLMELQGKIHSIQSSLRQTEAQLNACQKQVGSAKVTKSAVSDLPEDTNMFQAVGRMYLKQPRQQIVADLDEAAENNEAKILKLKDSKEYLVKSMKEAEDQARELLTRG